MKLLFLNCFLFISVAVYSQAGIYRTYNDFLIDEVIEEYAEYEGGDHAFGKFVITFKTKDGREREFKIEKDKYWGYKAKMA